MGTWIALGCCTSFLFERPPATIMMERCNERHLQLSGIPEQPRSCEHAAFSACGLCSPCQMPPTHMLEHHEIWMYYHSIADYFGHASGWRFAGGASCLNTWLVVTPRSSANCAAEAYAKKHAIPAYHHKISWCRRGVTGHDGPRSWHGSRGAEESMKRLRTGGRWFQITC